MRDFRNLKSQISKMNDKINELSTKMNGWETREAQQNQSVKEEDIIEIIR